MEGKGPSSCACILVLYVVSALMAVQNKTVHTHDVYFG
jgi:hypothetical protein